MINNDIKNVLISKEEIENKVKELGEEINKDYKNKNLLLVCILKGSLMFMADLMKNVDIYIEIDFMGVSSYGNSIVSSGQVRIMKDLDMCVEGKDILIIEDIIDTGVTLNYICNYIRSKGARSVEIMTLLDKPSGRKVEIEPKYKGFKVGNEFVVGYGLDYAEKYRNLPYIGVLDESVYK
ncbi:hypoxanthine phosphoribosyltransferase [Candidatus Arthromitus sp. SFB-rat-Yit]|uniref:hypoxanthine phosphoribosyltransferase n=1 Tax=Candidatus Arthromitus sp. SFB-rat-Yit TaxID=1041504 RepID=UPI000227A09A|nr:hypoxanthine phosphoribosyltransferase [Candidatus Arthromitus sp. SFB-rat-Yit]BAK81832.1 hypoxanthine phosphoribosyltransferase [Candidatus Arthromitus sp. SFB-rat-Yit]